MKKSKKKIVKKKVSRSDPNIICALPDSVLYGIFSFLDMKEVVGTSLVSRRWRDLWASTPVLNFDHNMWDGVKDPHKEGFMNFVDKVLFFHDGSKVGKFQIYCPTLCDSARVAAWLTVAARKQFLEVHLSSDAMEPLELPHRLFTSAITLFKLHMIDPPSNSDTIKVPKSLSSSPQLKTLRLHLVEFPQGNASGEFMLSCPVLENLTLEDCYYNNLTSLIISAPQLKSLVILNYDHEWLDVCRIEICTPNLTSLFCTSFSYSSFSLMKYSSLVDATIDFSLEQLDTHNLVELLRALVCARTIELSFVDSIYELNDLTSQFSNLRHLKLAMNGDNKLCISAVLQLLKNAPCIETLLLDAQELEDYEEEVLPFKCSHLKSVDIADVKECELKFLEYLLKNAVVLEKLRIRMCPDSSVDAKDKVSVKVQSLPRTSTNIIVVIL